MILGLHDALRAENERLRAELKKIADAADLYSRMCSDGEKPLIFNLTVSGFAHEFLAELARAALGEGD